MIFLRFVPWSCFGAVTKNKTAETMWKEDISDAEDGPLTYSWSKVWIASILNELYPAFSCPSIPLLWYEENIIYNLFWFAICQHSFKYFKWNPIDFAQLFDPVLIGIVYMLDDSSGQDVCPMLTFDANAEQSIKTRLRLLKVMCEEGCPWPTYLIYYWPWPQAFVMAWLLAITKTWNGRNIRKIFIINHSTKQKSYHDGMC